MISWIDALFNNSKLNDLEELMKTMFTQIRRIRNQLRRYFIRHRQNENSILIDPDEIPNVLNRRIQTPAI